MKQYLLLIILLLHGGLLSAQNNFIQPGAEWHYDGHMGSFRQYTSEVNYQGVPCHKLSNQVFVDTFYFYQGFRINDMGDVYVYNSSDTVFIYNEIFGKFTPLYVFNVDAGDTLCLPLLPNQGGMYITPGDSTFCIIVDSVKMELYDTTLLKSVFVSPLEKNGIKLEYKKYTWRIGTPSGILPKCRQGCAFPLSDQVPIQGDLRCYSDTTISVKYVSDHCVTGLPTSVSKLAAGQPEIRVFPNPANHTLYISNTGHYKLVALEILGTDGRIYHRYQDNIPGAIDVSALPPSLYLLRLHLSDGSSMVQKIAVE